jgi:arginine-tRNA-protein transferase
MNTVIDPRLKQLQLYLTASYPCSYLPQNEARSQVVSPSHGVGRDTYSHLIRLGFRRSGLFTYRPSCDTCQACLPFRVLARHFLPTRSQKRAWVKHQHLLARVMPPAFQAAHYELFMRYQSDRHSDGGMNHDSAEQYTQFLLRSQVESYLVEFTDPTTKAIKIVSLIDVTEDGISAVYTF